MVERITEAASPATSWVGEAHDGVFLQPRPIPQRHSGPRPSSSAVTSMKAKKAKEMIDLSILIFVDEDSLLNRCFYS